MILGMSRESIKQALEENELLIMADDFIKAYENEANKEMDEIFILMDDYLDGVIDRGIEKYIYIDDSDPIVYHHQLLIEHEQILDSLVLKAETHNGIENKKGENEIAVHLSETCEEIVDIVEEFVKEDKKLEEIEFLIFQTLNNSVKYEIY